MLNERKGGLPRLLVLVQWNSMFLSRKIQRLINLQTKHTYLWKKMTGILELLHYMGKQQRPTQTPECLQSLSRMGEASPPLWVASGGSDGPFGHHCWSPQVAAVILSVWGHDTGLRGCKAFNCLLYHLPEASFWPSLSIAFSSVEGTYYLPREELWDQR